MKTYVLDSYALLTYLQDEAGADEVDSLISSARAGEVKLVLSVVNLGEIAYIVERAAGLAKAQATLGIIDQLPIDLVEVNRHRALWAAHYKASLSIAYADCFALALAEETGGRVVTGDPEFKPAEGKVPVFWLPANR